MLLFIGCMLLTNQSVHSKLSLVYNNSTDDDGDTNLKINSLHHFYFSAEALQSIVLLMGKQQMYTHWHGAAKVQHLEQQWSEDEASQVLEAWKREFTKVKISTTFISRGEEEVCT